MVTLGHVVTPFSTHGANLFAAVLLFAAFLLVYWKADLLAAMAAMVGAKAVLAPCAMLAQPSGSVRALAVPLLLTWGIVLAASLHTALRGHEAEDVPLHPLAAEPVEQPTGKTGRIRLEAEFEVARKAQQDALPLAAPVMDGYTLAGFVRARAAGGRRSLRLLPAGRRAVRNRGGGRVGQRCAGGFVHDGDQGPAGGHHARKR